jgi:hypothetical protein
LRKKGVKESFFWEGRQGKGELAMDEELERFKTQIDLIDFAASCGYAVDERHFRAGARSIRLASERDKIIVARNGSNGHWMYFTLLNEGDSGTIIDFVQNRERLSFGQVRQRLRRWLGSANGSAFLGSASGSALDQQSWPRLKLEPLERDQAALLRAWALTRAISSHSYLEGERAIGKEVLATERFAGRLRTDGRGNAVFPHFDAAGEVSGWELKNAGFTGFATGGRKGLWLSNEFEGDARLIVAESAIDALSHAALWPDAEARYASTGGGFGETAVELLRLAAGRLPENGCVTLAFDNDAAGSQYAEIVRAGLEGAGRSIKTEFPPSEVKDWNDLLRSQRRD